MKGMVVATIMANPKSLGMVSGTRELMPFAVTEPAEFNCSMPRFPTQDG